MEKEMTSVKDYYTNLIELEKTQASKLEKVKDLAEQIVAEPSQNEAEIGLLVAELIEVYSSREESAEERFEKFRKARVGQILQQAKFDTEYGVLQIKRHKLNPDAMALTIQLKRQNGLTVVLEFHDALVDDFSTTIKRFQQFMNEGTLGDYVIQAYESVVAL